MAPAAVSVAGRSTLRDDGGQVDRPPQPGRLGVVEESQGGVEESKGGVDESPGGLGVFPSTAQRNRAYAWEDGGVHKQQNEPAVAASEGDGGEASKSEEVGTRSTSDGASAVVIRVQARENDRETGQVPPLLLPNTPIRTL